MVYGANVPYTTKGNRYFKQCHFCHVQEKGDYMRKNIKIAALMLTALLTTGMSAHAAQFDPAFYGTRYPDVVSVLGTDPAALYDHYKTYGMKEGRLPCSGAMAGEAVDGMADTKVPEGNGLVALKDLANKSAVRKKLTDAELQAAYNAAIPIVQPLAGKSRQEQLTGIAAALRGMADSGQVAYSTSCDHYNDPYGYLISGAASCAGCARTTGLCLNMLGIPFEHVNPNKWMHQWARVQMDDGSYWICDAYGLYVGPEPAPYQHPRVAY